MEKIKLGAVDEVAPDNSDVFSATLIPQRE